MTTNEQGEIVFPLTPPIPPHQDGNELVLCVPAWLPRSMTWGPGIITETVAADCAVLFQCMNLAFIDRPAAEVSEDWVQLIPYCLLRKDDAIFRYRRKGSEGRLTGLYSVGVGGHVNPVDLEEKTSLIHPYQNALAREIWEEVGLLLPIIPNPVALIYDPSNDVGRVHLGVVHLLNVPSHTSLTMNDSALQGGEFIPQTTLKAHCEAAPSLYETWSRLAITHLLGAP